MPRAGSRPPLDCIRLKWPGEAPGVERLRELPEIAVYDGLHVRSEHSRRGALVFAELAVHVARARDPDAGKALGDHRCDPSLMRGVRVAVEEADRDGLVVAALQRLCEAVPRCVLIQGDDHLPVRADAFGHLERVAARHHGLGLAVVNVVDGAPALPLEGEQIAEPLGGEERHLRTLALQHGVGGHGRAVHEILGDVQCQTRLVERCDRPAVRTLRRARHLCDTHAVRLERDEIGERAADLDPHPDSVAHACPRVLLPMRMGDGVIALSRLEGAADTSPEYPFLGTSLTWLQTPSFGRARSGRESRP